MSGMLPSGQSVRKAVQWISDELISDESKNKMELINQASLKFDLSPLETNQLIQFYSNTQSNI